jgi:CRISPR-associated endonuclease Csn1
VENVYGKDRDMIEKIIFWGTVFGNDKKIIRKKLKEEFGDVLNEEQIMRISGFSFTSWGNLSKEFLEMPGMEGTIDADKSIILELWESNENLMELLGGTHSFRDELDRRVNKCQKEICEWTIEDLDDMYLSPSVKRMVWQTLRVLMDIYSVKGTAPEKIFVEMPREDGEKGKRTQSRKKKLQDLYKGQKDFLNEISQYEERAFKQRKLYLYYLQNCKSMYTGKEIDLEDLLSNNSRYDIDHIYPRHYIKDDSLDNNLVLAEKEVNNEVKGGDYPVKPDIQAKMGAFWKDLLKKGFITKEKYDRLTRKTEFTEQEQADFIARQLVETRQGTKAITQILKQAFPETKIVFSKAGIVSDFRHKYELPKVRCLNNCHHAHDAYLNIVVGNTYYVKFTANPLNFIKEAGKKWRDPTYHYHMDRLFEYVVERNGETAWIHQNGKDPGTIKNVKAMMAKTSVLMTYKPYMEHGAITNKATVYSAETAKGKEISYMAVKTSDRRLADVSKYGGVTSIANAAYALVQYKEKGKTSDDERFVRALIGVPVYLGKVSKNDEKLIEYLFQKVTAERSKKKIEDFSVRMFPIRFGDAVIVDGFRYVLKGATKNNIYLKDFLPLYLSTESQAYVKKIEKATSFDDYDEQEDGQNVITSEKNIRLYKELVDKLTSSIYKNKKANIAPIISGGIEVFSNLEIKQQCYLIIQIISWFNTSTQSADLALLGESGGSAHSGILTLKGTISDYNEVVLVENSPTGLYEKRVNLLKV